ncbi:translation initiation factor IF-2, partial [Tremellales sp. Uapishka_1]
MAFSLSTCRGCLSFPSTSASAWRIAHVCSQFSTTASSSNASTPLPTRDWSKLAPAAAPAPPNDPSPQPSKWQMSRERLSGPDPKPNRKPRGARVQDGQKSFGLRGNNEGNSRNKTPFQRDSSRASMKDTLGLSDSSTKWGLPRSTSFPTDKASTSSAPHSDRRSASDRLPPSDRRSLPDRWTSTPPSTRSNTEPAPKASAFHEIPSEFEDDTDDASSPWKKSRGQDATRSKYFDPSTGQFELPAKKGKKHDAGRKEREMRERVMNVNVEKPRKAKPTKPVKDKAEEDNVFIPSTVSVSTLASIFGVKLFNLQKKMNRLGMTADQQRGDYLLNSESAIDLALEFNKNPIVDDERSFDIYPDPEPVDLSTLPSRPPVVTIMGHVDHGKTTLLDSLRHTSVAASEAGGITQHIGAFSVPIASSASSTITFLDTPGHAAFTAMRARGASVTDIVVLVVAADDGVMPQTREVLELVKSEGDKVGLVVAINKCDKPGVDVAKVKSALGAEGILLEEDGGDIPSVRVSGLTKLGLDDLVETLSTVAELRDLKARQEGKAEGYVLESRVDKGRGNVATVLVSRGTLRTGASIVAGHTWCRVRQMQDDKGRSIKSASPGMPVSITGWKDLPLAGDELLESLAGEEDAKKAITNRLREAERTKMLKDTEEINSKRIEERLKAEAMEQEAEEVKKAGGNVVQALSSSARKAEQEEEKNGFKWLRLVIKADVSGTVEAVVGSLEGIGNKEAGVKIVHTGVGDVSESDIALAGAAEATVIGFSVVAPRSIQTLASKSSVPLQLETVIYRLIDTVRLKVAGLLPPLVQTRVTGEATVNQIFSINVKGRSSLNIAGCRVGNGTISKAESVRVLRGPERTVIYEGTIDTLKHMKKDVTEVRKGTECGINFHGFQDIKEGDEVVTYTTFEVPREL